MRRVRQRGWVCWVLIWCCAVCAAMLSTRWEFDFDALGAFTADRIIVEAREGVIECSVCGRHEPLKGRPASEIAVNEVAVSGRNESDYVVHLSVFLPAANRWWVETRVVGKASTIVTMPMWIAVLPVIVLGLMCRLRLMRETGVRWRLRRVAWHAGLFAMVCSIVAFVPRWFTNSVGVTLGGRRVAVVCCQDMVALSTSGGDHERFEINVPYVFYPNVGSGLVSVPGYRAQTWGGVGLVSGPKGSGAAAIELWTLLGLLAVPTAVLAWWTRFVPVKPGACVACGYDLAGARAGVCPECGERCSPPVVTSPPSTAAS